MDDRFGVALTEVVWNGTTHALLFESGAYAVWLNTEAILEAGWNPASPSVTWSEVDVGAEAMTTDDAASGSERIGFLPWVSRGRHSRLAGRRCWYDEENRKITAVSDENMAAFEGIRQYAQKYYREGIERFRPGVWEEVGG